MVECSPVELFDIFDSDGSTGTITDDQHVCQVRGVQLQTELASGVACCESAVVGVKIELLECKVEAPNALLEQTAFGNKEGMVDIVAAVDELPHDVHVADVAAGRNEFVNPTFAVHDAMAAELIDEAPAGAALVADVPTLEHRVADSPAAGLRKKWCDEPTDGESGLCSLGAAHAPTAAPRFNERQRRAIGAMLARGSGGQMHADLVQLTLGELPLSDYLLRFDGNIQILQRTFQHGDSQVGSDVVRQCEALRRTLA